MTRLGWLVAGCLLALSSEAVWAASGESEVADHALAIVLAELGASIDSAGISLPGIQTRIPEELWAHATFGDISERLVGNDIRPSRFHELGKTIWEELGYLTREALEARWSEASRPGARTAVERGAEDGLALLERGEGNVVASYVALHVLALRFAAMTGNTGSTLRLALVYEAAAEAYLRAAFFAAHMRVPFGSPFWSLHAENTRRMHHHFRDTGLFVQNSSGDTWQTFGDDVLESHPPTYRFVLEASATSLRELFLVFLLRAKNEPGALRLVVSSLSDTDLIGAAQTWTPRYRDIIRGHHALLPPTQLANRFLVNATLGDLQTRIERWLGSSDAPETYLRSNDAFMPTLRFLPIPVAASMVERDSTGVFSSYEHPQLEDAGYHDPELSAAELRHLPSRSQFPMTADVRRWQPEYVSVLYPAPHAYPPSFLGLRTDVGLAQLAGEGGSTIGFAAGLGYAWPAGLYDVFLRVGYISGVGDGFLIGSFGPRVENPFPGGGLRWIDAFLLEIGYVHDLEGSWSESGGVLGLSAVTRAWSGLTPFVNMGPALQIGGRVYVRKLPLVGFFAAIGFQ